MKSIRSLWPYCLICLVTYLFASCWETKENIKGSGILAREERSVPPFTQVALKGIGSVRLWHGKQPSVVIEADDNLIPHLLVSVKDGILTLDTEKRISLNHAKSITYNVVCSSLTNIDVLGAGKVATQEILREDLLNVRLTGSGEIALDLDCRLIDVEITGSGSVTIRGEAEEQRISMSGVGKYSADALMSKRAAVSISGIGNAEINATDKLDISISGVGSVGYRGSPEIRKHGSGVSTIYKIGNQEAFNETY